MDCSICGLKMIVLEVPPRAAIEIRVKVWGNPDLLGEGKAAGICYAEIMKPAVRLLILVLLAVISAACAPPQSMVATLTMLPGSPTPPPPDPYPTRTPRFTPTATRPAPTGQPTAMNTISPADCPAGEFAFRAPEDPSLMIGLSFDPANLPEAFALQDQGLLSNGDYRWMWVRWQNRSLFWIDRMVCRTTTGRPHWVVVDTLALPRLSRESYEAESRLCFLDERRIPNAVAYGFFDPNAEVEQLADGRRGRPVEVQAAWEIGRSFTPLDLSDLRCYAE